MKNLLIFLIMVTSYACIMYATACLLNGYVNIGIILMELLSGAYLFLITWANTNKGGING